MTGIKDFNVLSTRKAVAITWIPSTSFVGATCTVARTGGAMTGDDP